MSRRYTVELEYYVVDAFTSVPFRGNQASVVYLPESNAYDDSTLLRISQEFNYQETAFLTELPPAQDGIPTYGLRWFTPVIEFPLCGHATLATAHTLFNGRHSNDSHEIIRFETMSGSLTARKPDPKSPVIELEFPADESVLYGDKDPALDARIRQAALEACPMLEGHIVGWAKAGLGWVIEISPEISLPACQIDCKSFLELGGMAIFTQPAPIDAAEDIWSRVFDPVEAIPEDPVTGSAHCILVCYWLGRTQARSRLPTNLRNSSGGDPVLSARQVSPRSGTMLLQWNRSTGKAKLRGQAVTMMHGTLYL